MATQPMATNSPNISRRTSLSYAFTGIAPRPTRRFSCDGSPLSLWSYLSSSISGSGEHLGFQFRHNRKLQYYPLEDDVDRRIIGTKVRYNIVNGNFQISNDPVWNMPGDRGGLSDFRRRKTSRNSLCEVYEIKLDPELVIHIGVVPGSKVPVITDRNPHLEGILDQRRIIYLPYTEDKNLFLELPNSPGLFFTTQRLNFGAEIFMLEDTTIHKNWIVLINEVFFHGRLRKVINGSTSMSQLEQEILWQESMVENLIYCERIIDLLNRKGFKPNIKFRLSPEGISPHSHHCHQELRANRGSPQPQSSLASADSLSGFEDDFEERLNMDEEDQLHSDIQHQTPQGNSSCLNVGTSEKMKNYYRDELKMSQGKAKFYLYEHDCLLFGFYENGNWSFGIKDQGPRSSGKEVSIQLDAEMANGVTNVQVRKAEYPL